MGNSFPQNNGRPFSLSLFPTWYIILFHLYTVSGFPLSSTCFRPQRPNIRRSKLHMQPVVLSPSAEGESTTGCMYNLDRLWGLKHVEERGNPDTVCRRKRIVYQVGNKDKLYWDARSTKYQEWETCYIIWCKNPEDHHLSNTHHENLKTYISNLFSVFDLCEIFFLSCFIKYVDMCTAQKYNITSCQPWARTCHCMAFTHNKHLYEFKSSVYLSKL
jgi:hypothetical protein